MTSISNRVPFYTEVDEDQSRTLNMPKTGLYAIQVNPPRNNETITSEGFVRSILEIQTGLFGFKNRSPTVTYEIQRVQPGRLQLQFCVPTKRMERKVRTQLSNQIPGIQFSTGTTKLPVSTGDSVGGGILSTGREHRYPLRTDFDSSPINNVIAGLHRHAMQDTKLLIQILFQPVAGRSINERWRKHRSYQTISYLNKEKEKIWGTRSPTRREKRLAHLIEQKQSQRRFWTSIRLAVIGAEDYTPSRVKEISGGFNIFENPESGQYINTTPIQGLRQKRFLEFYNAIHNRKFGGYSHRFQTSVPELAGLVSIPSRNQKNMVYAEL